MPLSSLLEVQRALAAACVALVEGRLKAHVAYGRWVEVRPCPCSMTVTPIPYTPSLPSKLGITYPEQEMPA